MVVKWAYSIILLINTCHWVCSALCTLPLICLAWLYVSRLPPLSVKGYNPDVSSLIFPSLSLALSWRPIVHGFSRSPWDLPPTPAGHYGSNKGLGNGSEMDTQSTVTGAGSLEKIASSSNVKSWPLYFIHHLKWRTSNITKFFIILNILEVCS